MAIDQNRISATISEEDLQFINSALAGITERLSFLPPEGPKRRVAGIDNTNKTFVEDVIKSYPSIVPILPDYVASEAEMKKDLQLFEQADKLLFTITDLAERLKTARTLAGLDVWESAKTVYQLTKFAAKNGNPSAKAAYDQLKPRFANGGRLSVNNESDTTNN